MATLGKRVTFRRRNMKSVVIQLSGRELPYPVYRLSGVYKYERPEVPGQQYRWL